MTQGRCGSLSLHRTALSSAPPRRLSGKAMARTGLRMMPTFPSPPLKVGSRTDAKLLRSDLSVAPRFLWECLTNRIVSWFSVPAASNRACPFRALGFLLASCQGLCDLSGWSDFPLWLVVSCSIAIEEPEHVLEPLPTPSLPAEPLALPRTHQMSPNFLFHPVFDHREAPS